MSSRVLSTEAAKAAISQIQSIINGGLTDQISALDAQGKILSEPNNWDGPLAETFRNDTWPSTNTALKNAIQKLDELHRELKTISTNIFTAGGGN
ncbi:pyrophosphorylase [Humibacter sp.]|uniref:pyrophosphorylase n=1 Tax=Humibacter sp. TaxID=1940291 RepID=UPI003F808705